MKVHSSKWSRDVPRRPQQVLPMRAVTEAGHENAAQAGTSTAPPLHDGPARTQMPSRLNAAAQSPSHTVDSK